MTHFLVLLLVLAGIGVYMMTAEERARIFKGAMIDGRYGWGHLRSRLWPVIALKGLDGDPFCDRLKARTPRLITTPTLIGANIVIYLLSGFGASLPTRAANGELSILVMSMLVHRNILQLLINLVALFQLGFVLERLVGSMTFAVIYFSAGLVAGMIGWSVSPSAANVGASGAIFGLLGLFVASGIWLMRDIDGWKIPVTVMKELAPVSGLFVLISLLTSSLGVAAELAGFATGLLGGVVLVRELSAHTPESKPVSIWSAVTLIVIALYVVLPHAASRQMTDVRPEIERVLALENYTSGEYGHAVERFRAGRITAPALADFIDQTVRPALQKANGRLQSLEHVRSEHKGVVALAQDYLRMRDESWRVRADALRKANMPELRQADQMERASLEVFGKVRPPEAQ